jgi:hypothetical protein
MSTATKAKIIGGALKQTVAASIGGSVLAGLFKAELTTEELVGFQLMRLKSVIEDLDQGELAGQRAAAFLETTDPILLQRILMDLEDAGLTDYDATVANHALDAQVVKVDKSLGLVFGWAIICKQDGSDYYDLNRDPDGAAVPEHIPEAAMLEAATDFMENSRVAKEMHDGEAQGTMVFAFPLTTDIAKAMGIETKTTGLLVAMKPSAAMLAKFASGELTGFSIGGSRVKSREEEAA